MFLFSKLFVVILAISCLLTCFVGCGADEEPEIASKDETKELASAETMEDAPEVVEEEPPPVILYPGAPVITIEKTAFNGWEGRNDPALHYRLKTEEPLPYDIKVRLSVRFTYTVDEWLYGDIDESKELEVDEVIEMRKDRLTYEDSIKGGSDTRIQTRTLHILPWKGPGDDPYNIGRPSRLKIMRKPLEGKVVPQLVSVEPPSDSEIAVNGSVILTFDVNPSDVKVISEFESLERTFGWFGQERDPTPLPQVKINDKGLILTEFPPGYKTNLEIIWEGRRSRLYLDYKVPPEVSIVDPPNRFGKDINEDDILTITFDSAPEEVIHNVHFSGDSGRVSWGRGRVQADVGNWKNVKGEMDATLNGKVLTLAFTDTTPIWPGSVYIDLKYSGKKRPDVYSYVTLSYNIEKFLPIELISIDPLEVQEGLPVAINFTFNKPPPGFQLSPVSDISINDGLSSGPFYWLADGKRLNMDPQPRFTTHRRGKTVTVTLLNGLNIPQNTNIDHFSIRLIWAEWFIRLVNIGLINQV